jgi:hypothetical protein
VAEEEAQVRVQVEVSAGTRVVAQVDIRSEEAQVEAQVEAHVVAQVEVRMVEAREGAQVVLYFEDAANEEAHVKARVEELLQRQ